MPAFKSGSPVPFSDVNLHDHTAHAPRWGPDSSTSEVTTIQLEFIDLSRQTGDPKYEVSLTYFFVWVLEHQGSRTKVTCGTQCDFSLS